MISESLAAALKCLRDVPIRYSADVRAFQLRVDKDKVVTKTGLTGVLDKVFPVPQAYDDEDDKARPSDVKVSKRARASHNDPHPAIDVWHRTKCRTASLPTCRDATLVNHVDGCDAKFGAAGIGPHFNKRHGMLVDQQLRFMVENGYSMMRACEHKLDPCVGTLRDHLAANDLCLVASQVPLYSRELDIATAFDVLATDRATRTELHLIEIKSTVGNSAHDASYVRVRGRLQSSAARGTPLSYYVKHQLQLGVMEHMITEALGRPPTSSRVLRVSPNCVRVYKLTPWYNARSRQLMTAIKKHGVRKQSKKQRLAARQRIGAVNK